jgi:hypothetical protein
MLRLGGVCLGLTPGFLRGLLPGRFGAVMFGQGLLRVGRIFFVTDRAWTSAAKEVRSSKTIFSFPGFETAGLQSLTIA